MQSFEEKQRNLQKAIEDLYYVFSSYKLRSPVTGCSCCVSRDDERRLTSKPLRQLQEEDLSLYSFKAMTTWGDEYDFKHFLPRLLELLAAGSSLFAGTELFPNKLNHAQWQTWPECERVAVQNYLMAAWECAMEERSGMEDSFSWLESIAYVVNDIQPFLQAWFESDTCETWSDVLRFVQNGGFIFHHEQTRRWLLDPRTDQWFEQLFFERFYEERAAVFAQIADAVRDHQYVAQLGEKHDASSEN